MIERHAFDRVEDEIVASVEAALGVLQRAGARIVRLASDVFDEVMEVGVPLVRSEAFAYHQQWFPARRDEYGPDVARSLDAAAQIPKADYRVALAKRRAMASTTVGLLEAVEVLAGPTVPVTAFPNRYAFETV